MLAFFCNVWISALRWTIFSFSPAASAYLLFASAPSAPLRALFSLTISWIFISRSPGVGTLCACLPVVCIWRFRNWISSLSLAASTKSCRATAPLGPFSCLCRSTNFCTNASSRIFSGKLAAFSAAMRLNNCSLVSAFFCCAANFLAMCICVEQEEKPHQRKRLPGRYWVDTVKSSGTPRSKYSTSSQSGSLLSAWKNSFRYGKYGSSSFPWFLEFRILFTGLYNKSCVYRFNTATCSWDSPFESSHLDIDG